MHESPAVSEMEDSRRSDEVRQDHATPRAGFVLAGVVRWPVEETDAFAFVQFLNSLGQGFAIDQTLAEEWTTIGEPSQAVDGRDTRMAQYGGVLCLATEPRYVLVTSRVHGAHRLYGHLAAEFAIEGEYHHSHPALTVSRFPIRWEHLIATSGRAWDGVLLNRACRSKQSFCIIHLVA
jgi:hypothetical protein